MSYRIIFTLLITLISLNACDYAANSLKSDRPAGLEDQDYKDALAPREPTPDNEASQSSPASIPKLQPYMSGNATAAMDMPLVTISLNQTVPLRSALYDLAQQANYDIVLDPRISGAIIYSARNKPLDEVIKSISKVAGLRYTFEGDTLRIELDTPFNKTYKVDYLNLVRTNSSSISTDVSVVSGDGADTGSSFESSFTNEIDFWGELETAMSQILASASTDILKTTNNPNLQVASVSPNFVGVGGNGAAPDVNININGDTGAVEEYTPPGLSFSVNRQAGIVQIFATERTHTEVKKYLDLLKKSVSSQVLIEAKVLEVTLSDEYETGIDWSTVGGIFGGDVNLQFTTPAAIDTATRPRLFLDIDGSDFSAVVDAAAEFGTVRALASPRLTVLNNQSAVLNVATNLVYFEIQIESTLDEGVRTTEVESEIKNVPEGVLINVQPSIDMDRGTVSMALRPTITAIESRVNDPGVAFVSASLPPDQQIQSQIPQLNVQELDTLVNMRSGQTIVMGGLLQDRVVNDNDGIPLLQDVPFAGSLFKKKKDSVQKTELIIFLKATILDQPGDSIHNTDKDLYRRFSDDRRPFAL